MKEIVDKIKDFIVGGFEDLHNKIVSRKSFIDLIKKSYEFEKTRTKEFEYYAEIFDRAIRKMYPDYLENRKIWLEMRKILSTPDPVIESIRFYLYCFFIFFFILFIFFVIIEFFKFFKHIKLYSLKNKYITSVNFLKLSIQEKYDDIPFLDYKVDLFPYQKILISLEVFLTTPFYESKNIEDFTTIINDLNSFQDSAIQDLNFDFCKEIYSLIDSFSRIVKKNNEKSFF